MSLDYKADHLGWAKDDAVTSVVTFCFASFCIAFAWAIDDGIVNFFCGLVALCCFGWAFLAGRSAFMNWRLSR